MLAKSPAFTFALRELRGGIKGFYVFIACIALGVATISGVGALSNALTGGLDEQGQAILGGDLEFSLIHREAGNDELGYIQSLGEVSTVATTRAMARVPDTGDQTLVELKAVDDLYPLVGTLDLEEETRSLADLHTPNTAFVERILLGRLGIEVGDTVNLGQSEVTIAGVIDMELDRLSSGANFGPRLMTSIDTLKATGLIQPGSLVTWRYRLLLPGETSLQDIETLAEEAREAYPEAGWRIRNRGNASPQVREAVESSSQFLTLVGLTALIVGGVGVGNAVRSFIDLKRPVIATFKVLGATGNTVFTIYLIQIAALTGLGTIIGLSIGALVLPITAWLIGDVVPLSYSFFSFSSALLSGLLFGFLTALVFALWPLSRAQDVPVSTLYRGAVDAVRGWPRKRFMAAIVVLLTLLIGLVVWFAAIKTVALYFIGAAVFSFAGLWVIARLIMFIAKRLPRSPVLELRYAISNIHRPGALTSSVILSLGLGVTLIVALTQIDRNLSYQLTSSLPESAPSFFFLDIQAREHPAFVELLNQEADNITLETAPMLRGYLSTLKGIPAADIEAPPEHRWVLRGDRGITHSETPPPGTQLVEGEWWAPDYDGPPLVSFEAEEGLGLGLKVGDTIAVNVLGRTIEATIANFKEGNWESLNINFLMVFSPNTFRGAPYTVLTTLTFDDEAENIDTIDERDAALLRSISSDFPTVTALRIRDALNMINGFLEAVALAIRSASGVTLLASICVLAGALAAGHRQRIYDAVVLKTLGATRKRLLLSFFAEYAVLGLVTAGFGVLAGVLASYAIISGVTTVDFILFPLHAVVVAGIAIALTIILGIGGTWVVLRQKPASVLRDH